MPALTLEAGRSGPPRLTRHTRRNQYYVSAFSAGVASSPEKAADFYSGGDEANQQPHREVTGAMSCREVYEPPEGGWVFKK